MLNKLLDQTNQNRDKTPMRYQHLHLRDSFLQTPDNEKLRVTRDQKTDKVVECIKKIRLGNLDVYSPKHNVDWRVSVNVEQHCKLDPVVLEASLLMSISFQYRNPLRIRKPILRETRTESRTDTKSSSLISRKLCREQVEE